MDANSILSYRYSVAYLNVGKMSNTQNHIGL